ncbi:hypothetical protein Mevan_0286 [Methanococcus vannielii SB]|uniref:Uncharacterized protein n=1 Tax=Methanococcus vannielii (strain ATCC 35089 / DSM 1224 / JCM 13029 / OCM 148 / SB) TaxID=406327 RepID=A6UNX3_METVS|nr:hypothetical protein [Methanococcus vannielii]ABR54195.1 hypothetical protein Mevan_0286 [Methanococcus vannielii SB]
MDKKVTTIIFIFLVIINIYQSFQIQGLSNEINVNNNQIKLLKYEIMNLGYNIDLKLDKIEKGPSLLEKSFVDVTNVYFEDKKMDVTISWTLKELKNDEKVYLNIVTKKSNETISKKILVDELVSLTYEEKLNLPINEHHVFYVVVKGSNYLKTSYIDELNIYEKENVIY